MILGMVEANIFNAEEDHIFFALNVDGKNNSNFVKEVSQKLNWPEIQQYEPCRLGHVFKKKHEGKMYYGLACYSLHSEIGWMYTPEIILNFLDSDIADDFGVVVAMDKTLATIMLGNDKESKSLGANPNKIREAIQESKRDVIIYTL